MYLFWEIIASNAVVAATLAIGAMLLSRVWKNAAAIHVLWVVVLLKLFTPPLVTAELPFAFTFLPSTAPPDSHERSFDSPADTEGEQTAREALTNPRGTVSGGGQQRTSWNRFTETVGQKPWSLSTILVAIWICGASCVAVFHTVRIRRFARIVSNFESPSPAICLMVKQLSNRLGLRRVPDVLMTSRTLPPLVWSIGVFPRVILPSGLFARLSNDAQATILAHELFHVRRGDHLVRLLELAATTVFWWHPVVKWASWQLRELEEQCCDSRVLELVPNQRRTYAAALVDALEFLSEQPRTPVPLPTAIHSTDSLSRRIRMLTQNRTNRLSAPSATLVAGLVALPLVVAFAADPEQTSKTAAKGRQPASAPATILGGRVTNEAGAPPGGMANVQGQKTFFGNRGGGVVFVAANEAVQKEIGIDSAAAMKITSIVEHYRQDMRAANKIAVQATLQLNELTNLSQEERKKRERELGKDRDAVIKKLNEESVAQLKAGVSAVQFERLRQIAWQVYGSQALATDPDLAKALELNRDQVKKIVTINSAYQKRRLELYGRTAFPVALAKIQEFEKERDGKAIEVLSKDQKEKLAQVEGKVFAFQPLRPQPRRQPLSGGTGGGGIFTGGIFTIVGIEAVQKELGLSQDAATKVKVVKDQFNAAWQKAGGAFRSRVFTLADGTLRTNKEAAMPPWGVRGGRGRSEKERNQAIAKMTEAWQATTAKFQPQLKDVLTADQFTRVQQINWQAMGTAAYSDVEVIQALAITKAQQDKISSVTDEYRAKREEMLGRRGGAGSGDLRDKMRELAKEQDKKINESLTKTQLDTFATMKGKEFDLDQLLDLNPLRVRGRAQGAGAGERGGAGRPK